MKLPHRRANNIAINMENATERACKNDLLIWQHTCSPVEEATYESIWGIHEELNEVFGLKGATRIFMP